MNTFHTHSMSTWTPFTLRICLHDHLSHSEYVYMNTFHTQNMCTWTLFTLTVCLHEHFSHSQYVCMNTFHTHSMSKWTPFTLTVCLNEQLSHSLYGCMNTLHTHSMSVWTPLYWFEFENQLCYLDLRKYFSVVKVKQIDHWYIHQCSMGTGARFFTTWELPKHLARARISNPVSGGQCLLIHLTILRKFSWPSLAWGWCDEWDNTALQTRDLKFELWQTEAEHATSELSTILSFTSGWGKNIFVSFKLPRPANEPRALAWKAAVLNTTLYTRAPALQTRPPVCLSPHLVNIM